MEFELQSAPGALRYLALPGFGAGRGKQGVRLVFTTRLGGVSTGPYAELNLGLNTGDDPALVIENRKLLCDALNLDVNQLSVVKQVHGDRVVVVDDTDLGSICPAAEADAQITTLPAVPLLELFADCLAIYLYDPVNGVIGLAHAGWRGTVSGIASKTVAIMAERFGTCPEYCHAALAPAAGPCCYEVGDDVAEVAGRVFSPEWNILRPRNRNETINGRKPANQGRWTLDLWSGNAWWLLRAGLKRKNIIISQFCTVCRQDLFFSYRGSGGLTGRMAALIILDA